MRTLRKWAGKQHTECTPLQQHAWKNFIIKHGKSVVQTSKHHPDWRCLKTSIREQTTTFVVAARKVFPCLVLVLWTLYTYSEQVSVSDREIVTHLSAWSPSESSLLLFILQASVLPRFWYDCLFHLLSSERTLRNYLHSQTQAQFQNSATRECSMEHCARKENWAGLYFYEAEFKVYERVPPRDPFAENWWLPDECLAAIAAIIEQQQQQQEQHWMWIWQSNWPSGN